MAWSVEGKTILITGATSGIGLEASAQLARLGAHVVMVGRDAARTERAVAAARSGARGDVSHFLCDFSSQASIRTFASAFRARHERLDVLINNAGGVQEKRLVTEDGIEATFAVNHLGYFLLTNLLLDTLLRCAPARVVVVSSIAHRAGTLDFDDLGFERGYWILKAYARSKLANVLFARELARRLDGTGVTCNSVHPGAVDTNIWSGAPEWAKPAIGRVLRPFFVNAARGAEPLTRLAASPELQGVTGRYFEGHRQMAPARRARSERVAARLWAESASLCGLPQRSDEEARRRAGEVAPPPPRKHSELQPT
jgi:NAD(P)-dependent dehydrogenase (short-subunit alcohol dehydrogenase family)